MIFPHKWMLKRPGYILPVFFLSLCTVYVTGQISVLETTAAALGGVYVTRSGFMSASHNQAGLGWIDDHSISLQHCSPFMKLGISSIAAQVKVQKGALGASISTFGITGLRQSSLWLSFGMKLSPDISAGLGMHFQTYSIPEKSFYHPGLGLALGIQGRINEHWVVGAHIQKMIISAGCSYSFFNTATWYSELHCRPGHPIQFGNGLEWKLHKILRLMIGINNQPFTWSAGLALDHHKWRVDLAFQYVTDTGIIPYTSFHHVW